MLSEFIVPHVGPRPIHEITAAELLTALRPIEGRGKHETAHRTKQYVGQVFRYAIATGRAERDITADLRGALTPVTAKNHAAVIDPAAIGALLRSIDGYAGQPVTHAALKLAPLVFVRPGELRQAEWSEINLDAAEWRIPARKMKMREPHVVPLSRQAVEILRELRLLTGSGQHVFPSIRTGQRPMSENTINGALRRLGYANDEMTGHGFRAMASTCLNEQGWHPDVIELQLAHAERNKVRAAYNRATRLGERRKMMQAWADYLDGLRAGAEILPFRRAVQGTDRTRGNDHATHKGTKNLYKAAWVLLVNVGILTQDESNELEKLIDDRNLIAHQIHNLTGDISLVGELPQKMIAAGRGRHPNEFGWQIGT